MDKIICPHCSIGPEITAEGAHWAVFSHAVVSWQDSKPHNLLLWYKCARCARSYFMTIRIDEEYL